MKMKMKYSFIGMLLLPCFSYAATYNVLEEKNDLSFTLDSFGSRVQSGSKEVITLIEQAEVAFKKGQMNESETLLLQAIAKVKVKGNLKGEAKLISILGAVYAKQQQAEKLLPLAGDLLKRFPRNSMALSILAGVQIVNKQDAQAEKTLRKIISQEPKDTNHRLLLINLIAKVVSREKEIKPLLDQVLNIQANNPKALLITARLQLKNKKFKQAAATIQTIEGFYPKQAIAHQLKGDLYLAEKKHAKALESYQQAYQIAPNNKVLYLLVDLMKVQGKGTNALVLLNDELKKNSKNSAVHFKLASIFQQLKDYKQAEKHYRAILAEKADNPLVLNNLAWVYLQQNKPEALGLAKRAYENTPKSNSIADTYGTILIKQGDKKLGLSILEKTAALVPKSDEIQYHLALAYSANGNKKKAIEILQKIQPSKQYFAEKKQASAWLKTLQGN